MKRIVTLLLAMLLTASPLFAQQEHNKSSTATNGSDLMDGELDMKNPAEVARAILQSYRQRDLNTLSELSLAMNRDFFKEIAEQGEQHPRYNSIFAGWRWDAVEAWDGRTADARQRGDVVAVKFHQMSDSEVAVVMLEKDEQGNWRFEDINSPAAEDFDRLAKYQPT